MLKYHPICFRKSKWGKGQTGEKNDSSTFVLTPFNFFGQLNIFLLQTLQSMKFSKLSTSTMVSNMIEFQAFIKSTAT
jgi:hypothetical protein